MKIYFSLTWLMLMIASKVLGQEIYDQNTASYKVKHYSFFSSKRNVPKIHEWSFSLNVKREGQNEYVACYSKELVNCLFLIAPLSKPEMSLNKGGCCIKYKITTSNNIKITDKKEVVEYLKTLKEHVSASIPKDQSEEILSNIDYYLEDDERLDEDLSREIRLIHEYENISIPIGVSGAIKENKEDFDINRLKADEKDFLARIDWRNLRNIELYRTQEIDESTFLFDYLKARDMVSSNQKADLEEVSKQFFEGVAGMEDKENVSINRDLRHLVKENHKLSYLLQGTYLHSPLLKKVTTLEITKK